MRLTLPSVQCAALCALVDFGARRLTSTPYGPTETVYDVCCLPRVRCMLHGVCHVYVVCCTVSSRCMSYVAQCLPRVRRMKPWRRTGSTDAPTATCHRRRGSSFGGGGKTKSHSAKGCGLRTVRSVHVSLAALTPAVRSKPSSDHRTAATAQVTAVIAATTVSLSPPPTVQVVRSVTIRRQRVRCMRRGLPEPASPAQRRGTLVGDRRRRAEQ